MNKIYTFLCFFAVIITLYLGLNFKGHDFDNTIKYTDEGLVFSKKSFALSTIKLQDDVVQELNESGFTLEFDIFPQDISSGYQRNFLRVVSEKNKNNSLNILFWKNQLITLIGDDFDYSKRDPRVTVKLERERYSISLKVDCSHLQLSVNGIFFKKVGLQGKCIQFTNAETSILLGGSLLSEKSWSGVIYSLTLMTILESEPNKKKKLLEYDFSKENFFDGSFFDLENKKELKLPVYPILYHRVFLRAGLFPTYLSKATMIDVVVNFFWFSILSSVIFIRIKVSSYSIKVAFILSFLISIFLSFFIEYAQSWIPIRDSSQRDLFLNSLGALLGVVAMSFFTKYKELTKKL